MPYGREHADVDVVRIINLREAFVFQLAKPTGETSARHPQIHSGFTGVRR
jgi:hypothetical protein